jgi:hypothetical protein
MDANLTSNSDAVSASGNVALPLVAGATDRWQPRTNLGRLLKELRQQFVASGGKLLSPEEIAVDLKSRRGDLGED